MSEKHLLDAPRRLAAALFGTAALALGLAAGPAAAQDFPTKSITMIVPNAAGTSSDIVARIVAERMGELLGKPVVVENVTGAAGVSGTNRVAKAAPDGYTIGLLNSATMAANVVLVKDLPYDPLKDFRGIGRSTVASAFLVVGANSKAKTVKELIAEAKANPGKLNYASQGVGTGSHFAAAYFANAAGIDVVHVPYNNVGQAFTDLVEGRMHFGFFQYNSVQSFVEGKRMLALATAAAKREALVPDVPSMSEAGLPGWTWYTWSGVFGPAGLPEPVLKKLSDAYKGAVSDPKVLAKLDTPVPITDYIPGDEFEKFLKEQIDRYRQIAAAVKIQAQ
jgi:tripartite-type tricarboxylate transporter receptor subunit TctC